MKLLTIPAIMLLSSCSIAQTGTIPEPITNTVEVGKSVWCGNAINLRRCLRRSKYRILFQYWTSDLPLVM